jgi:hypothetical protein
MGAINQNSTWSCDQSVNLTSVTIMNPTGDAVLIKAGCTGYIGMITVVDNSGDPIHIGNAQNLEIGNVNLTCNGHNSTVHQDGIQVMGGTNIRIDSGYVGCYSANDSQMMIHGGTGGSIPTNVIINGVTVDPRGAGAYGVTNGKSKKSGFTCLKFDSLANRHDLYWGGASAAPNPVWSFQSPILAGLRSNFNITAYPTC